MNDEHGGHEQPALGPKQAAAGATPNSVLTPHGWFNGQSGGFRRSLHAQVAGSDEVEVIRLEVVEAGVREAERCVGVECNHDAAT